MKKKEKEKEKEKKRYCGNKILKMKVEKKLEGFVDLFYAKGSNEINYDKKMTTILKASSQSFL